MGNQQEAHASSASLDFWASRAESFGAALPRSLELLRDIESTLSSRQLEREIFESISRYCDREAHRIRVSPEKQKMDKDGAIRRKLLSAQVSFKQHHARLITRCNAARADNRLHEDDGIVEAYNQSINAIAELHNHINALRWAIGEHDADLSEVIGKFDTAEAVTAFLNAKSA